MVLTERGDPTSLQGGDRIELSIMEGLLTISRNKGVTQFYFRNGEGLAGALPVRLGK